MPVRVAGAAGQDIASPAVRTADFDELMREDPGVAAGESVRFGNRRSAGLDGPRFELRREARAVEQSARETRRGLTPFGRIKAHGDIIPRAHRRTPFPDSELTLARPTRALEEPGRAEVIEKRKEH